ncbi:MAG TPA: 50S ribosomal protein L29 [Bacteroidales bacterium]|jgi:large subunit ribosomal protein L29|nr:50S ribosomal protein L29 [Bacteroidales bacterium]HRR48483.1 50S ribosomal protein L29 [Bacteroidales bacterium]HRT32910.1 50S ribosomal protein L29 [Bacteroidales bacterium]HRT83052.1 50S ribosomal protein L29 [Bacteroidales bacterium]
MKTKEVRELSINDLKERIEAEKANLLRMKMNHAISPIDDLSKMKKSRKDIARMLTILTQKQNIDK